MERRQSVMHILSLALDEYTRKEVASDRSRERVSQTGDSCGGALPPQKLRPCCCCCCF